MFGDNAHRAYLDDLYRARIERPGRTETNRWEKGVEAWARGWRIAELEAERAARTIADVLDPDGNALDVCGHCTLVPTTTGWVRGTQRGCPTHSPEA